MYAVCQGFHVGHSIPVALMTREADERGPIAIFWDIENCGIPSDVPAEVVAANMKRSMRTHPETDGAHYRGMGMILRVRARVASPEADRQHLHTFAIP